MTEQHPAGAAPGPDHLVAQAERQLAALGVQIDQLIETLGKGETEAARDVAPVAASLRKALEAIFHERARLERLAERDTAGPGGFDLDAARAEITRRLARLAAAAGSSDLSG